MIRRIRVAPKAAAEIQDAVAWWAINRAKNPDALAQSIQDAFQLILEFPRAGQRVQHESIGGIRRLLLGHVRYNLFYRIGDNDDAVEVLALWHASRGSVPDLG